MQSLLLEVWIYWFGWRPGICISNSLPRVIPKLFLGYFHKVFWRQWNWIEKIIGDFYTGLTQTPKAVASVAAHLWSLLGPSYSERSRRYCKLCILFVWRFILEWRVFSWCHCWLIWKDSYKRMKSQCMHYFLTGWDIGIDAYFFLLTCFIPYRKCIPPVCNIILSLGGITPIRSLTLVES